MYTFNILELQYFIKLATGINYDLNLLDKYYTTSKKTNVLSDISEINDKIIIHHDPAPPVMIDR